ncbi:MULTISPECIES: hypothetical protein [Bacillales]|uniref:hypothetical protein n=1 Tax=Bacillales TaxID=1385 RepID=UPI000518E51D|nr:MULTISPECIES: hypothetical protein [Bacillaceae]MDE3841117.1 hypothetical protein [Bacillus methanolicus]MED4332528.1 hypothetical protein [Geobacillus stearothermophilus]MED4995429.1 hypothetical protein [Geobacillus stearothermophilus]
MKMFKTQVNERLSHNETWAEVIEDIFARVEGAYEYDVISDEQIQSLHKRVVEITNESGERIAEVVVNFYPNENYDEDDLESGKYIVEVELVEGKE